MVNFELRQIFENFNKTDIYNIAKEKGLKGISKCTKDQLISKLCEYMLKPEVAEHYFICQQDEQIAEFKKAAHHGGAYVSEQSEFLFDLCSVEYLGILENGEVIVPDAVNELYQEIATEAFHEKRKVMSHLLACLRISGILYGITPIHILLKLVNQCQGIHMTEDELKKLLKEIPAEYMEYVEVDGKIYHKEFYPKDNGLLAVQGKKNFYIPTLKEIREFGIHGSLSDSPEFIRMRTFLIEEFQADEDTAETACRIIQRKICGGASTEEVYDVLNELELFANDDQELTRLVICVQDFWNETRMLLNRGYTPNELKKMQKKESKVILPLAKPENGENVKVQKVKIYPNAPCPCGSGKKYKKCCGKA